MSAVNPPSSEQPIPDEKQKGKEEKPTKVSAVAKKKIKSHEAEDRLASRKITRQSSSPNLKKDRTADQSKTSAPDSRPRSLEKSLQEIKEQDLKMKTSPNGLWEAIDVLPDKFGGRQFIYKLRNECDGITPSSDRDERYRLGLEKMDKMFPAIEFAGEIVIDLVPDIDREKMIARRGKIPQEELKRLDLLRELGFGIKIIENGPEKGFYLYLPNKEALLARWEKLREKNPKLPNLDILSSEGIADDITFLLAFFTHHVVLSTGEEFVHDLLAHVIPTLLGILESTEHGNPTYQQERARLVKLVASSYRRILVAKRMIEEGKVKTVPQNELNLILERINTMIRVLGAFVDQTTAGSGPFPQIDKEFLEQQFQDIWEDSRWGPILNQKGDPVDALRTIWKQMTEIEKEFDKLYPKAQTKKIKDMP